MQGGWRGVWERVCFCCVCEMDERKADRQRRGREEMAITGRERAGWCGESRGRGGCEWAGEVMSDGLCRIPGSE